MNREQYVFPRRPVQAGDRDAPDMSPCMILLLSEDKLFHFSFQFICWETTGSNSLYMFIHVDTYTNTHTLKKIITLMKKTTSISSTSRPIQGLFIYKKCDVITELLTLRPAPEITVFLYFQIEKIS